MEIEYKKSFKDGEKTQHIKISKDKQKLFNWVEEFCKQQISVMTFQNYHHQFALVKLLLRMAQDLEHTWIWSLVKNGLNMETHLPFAEMGGELGNKKMLCGLLPQNLNWNANAFSFLFVRWQILI